MKDEAYDAFLKNDPPIATALKELLPSNVPLIIFDIGACEGEDSIRYARLFPQAHIFSFEPLPDNQALIRYHFERHRVERCELVPIALSNSQGEGILHISSGAPENKVLGEDWNYGNKSNSLLAPAEVKSQLPWLKFEREEIIRINTLDNFCQSRELTRVDFLHIDVQGAESLVIEGAAKMLPTARCVWLEVAICEVYQGQKLKHEIEALMKCAGFGLVYEAINGAEGDQFYVNTRFWRGRLKVSKARLKRTIKKILVVLNLRRSSS